MSDGEIRTNRDLFDQLVEDFAGLLRSHTRAIWALKGETEYPEDERSAMGAWGQECLQFARMQSKVWDEARAVEVTDEMVERAARAWEPDTFHRTGNEGTRQDALADARRALVAALDGGERHA